MSVRGQGPEAWCARWRRGNCPVHGVGFVPDTEGEAPEGAKRMKCPHDECVVRAAQYPGKDEHHAFFGWLSGPLDVRLALTKGGDVATQGPAAGGHARSVRVSWPLEE